MATEFSPSSVTKSSLSLQRQRLIALMQRLNFGRIEQLHIQDGEPVFDPLPRVIRKTRFGGDNGPNAMTRSEDFVLKGQVREFLAQLDVLGNVTILTLEVKHGLPFDMEHEEVIA